MYAIRSYYVLGFSIFAGTFSRAVTVMLPPASAGDKRRLFLADKTDNVLDTGNRLVGDRVRAFGAVDKNAVDMARIGEQAPHLGRDRRNNFV